MVLSSIYMALHTFKVLCKHSLINLCFRNPVQQSKRPSLGAELCLLGLAGSLGLPMEMETAPAGKVQLSTSGRYQEVPFCPQERCETAETCRNGPYRQERDTWWWLTVLTPQCRSSFVTWRHLIKVSAFSWASPNSACSWAWAHGLHS